MTPDAALPQHTVAKAVEDLGFEMLIETADLIESIAISMREAAWRRDRAEVRLRLDHLRVALNAAIETDQETNGDGRTVA